MPKITRAYQEGQCSICESETLVRIVLNNKKAACVCMSCLKKVGNLSINELLDKYGNELELSAS
ncbi:MAG: hypothetical protein WC307_02595 [Candidatus Nanoarchaeia archaeon]|jgi:hypothetical protein